MYKRWIRKFACMLCSSISERLQACLHTLWYTCGRDTAKCRSKRVAWSQIDRELPTWIRDYVVAWGCKWQVEWGRGNFPLEVRGKWAGKRGGAMGSGDLPVVPWLATERRLASQTGGREEAFKKDRSQRACQSYCTFISAHFKNV